MTKWILAYGLLVLLLISSTESYAQNNRDGLGIRLIQTEIKVVGKELTSVGLKIFNYGSSKVKANLKIKAEDGLQLISRDTLITVVSPDDSLFVSAKLFVSPNLIAGKEYKITFKLYNEKTLISEQACVIKVDVIRQVKLVPQISSIILNNLEDSIRVPLRVVNAGNVTQKVNIIARFPSSIQSNGFHDSRHLILEPYMDTLIYINKKVTRDLLRFDSFSINVTGLFLNGDVFGQANIDVQQLKNIRHNRVVIAEDIYNQQFNNRISINAQNFGSDFANYQVTGGGTVDFPAARIGYNIDAMLYQYNMKQPFIRDTYMSFESHNMGISVGNITRNFDMNLNGRGSSVFIVDTLRGSRYEGGYIDNSANLVGPGYIVYDSGSSVWGKFEHQGKGIGLKNFAVYNKDPFMKVDNMLFGNELSWTAAKNLKLSGSLSGGTTSPNSTPGKAKVGALVGLNVEGKLGNFYFNSANILSSKYYPGLRKGTSIFTERVTYSFKKLNLWAGFNYFNFEPGYAASFINYVTNYGSSRAEMGISTSVLGISLLVSPLYSSERGIYFLALDNLASGKMESIRLVTQLNYTGNEGRQSLYMNVEAGLSENSFYSDRQSQFKVNGNYRRGIFGLNANFQYGNFFVNEFLNNYASNRISNINFNINPTVQKSFFKNRTRLELGVSYSNVSSSGESWQLTGRTEHRISLKTELFASLARSQYNFNQYNFEYSNFQFGIIQTMPTARIGSKNHTLEVTFYRDENQNGIHDKGDSELKGELVYVDRAAFITDKYGKITYKNLPPGNYRISIPKGSWYAPDQHIVINEKDVKLDIPLSRTSTLKGMVEFKFNDFSYEVQKEKLGLTVLAKEVNGNVIKTKTDDGGRFNFYLPTGNYTVTLDLSELPEQMVCDNNDQVYSMTPDKTQVISFTLSVKSRKIETKKFISTKEREKEAIRDNDRDKDRDRDKDKQKR